MQPSQPESLDDVVLFFSFVFFFLFVLEAFVVWKIERARRSANGAVLLFFGVVVVVVDVVVAVAAVVVVVVVVVVAVVDVVKTDHQILKQNPLK